MPTLAVIGSGLMGSGIAQVAAVAGYDVVLHDVSTT
jgi:3-hydroxybutyryl-CoA dehydrogenase